MLSLMSERSSKKLVPINCDRGWAMSKLRIAVLYGGISSEREVSLRSGANVHSALVRAGYEQAFLVDVDKSFPYKLASYNIDVAWIALLGRYGEDGCIQGLLECAGIPYTHSGVLASAVAMDKWMSYMVFKSVGIPCPESVVVKCKSCEVPKGLVQYPCIIKPIDEGSTIGVKYVESASADHTIEQKYIGRDMMVSRYIPGRELTVAVIGKGDEAKALGILEATNFGSVFGYDSKYNSAETGYITPAVVSKELAQELKLYAERAHKTLGCAGVTRSDFRCDGDAPYLLELNTLPAFTERSMVPKIAAAQGITFEELVESVLLSAL
jgi:D-alanine-D-alanine ligase